MARRTEPIQCAYLTSLTMNTTPKPTRQGYRYFKCDGEDDDGKACGHVWREPTRDHQSPSGENCPMCNAWVFPHYSEPDATLRVDSMGNLWGESELRLDREKEN